MDGESAMDGLVATKVLDYFQQKNELIKTNNLSAREREILQLAVKENINGKGVINIAHLPAGIYYLKNM